MGLFDFVGGVVDEVGSVAQDVAGAAAGIVQNPFVQFGLNAGGTLFGDPGLGTQLAGGVTFAKKLFGGSPSPPPRSPGHAPVGYSGGVPVPLAVPDFGSRSQ